MTSPLRTQNVLFVLSQRREMLKWMCGVVNRLNRGSPNVYKGGKRQDPLHLWGKVREMEPTGKERFTQAARRQILTS